MGIVGISTKSRRATLPFLWRHFRAVFRLITNARSRADTSSSFDALVMCVITHYEIVLLCPYCTDHLSGLGI